MNAWWQGLNSRERRLVSIAAVLLLIAVGWMGIWKPLSTQRLYLQQDIQAAKDINIELQQKRNEILQLRNADNTEQPTKSGNLYGAVTHLLKKYHLDGEGSSASEKDENHVSLKLENKSFDQLVRFLGELETSTTAHANSMNLKAGKSAGLVEALVELQR